MPRQEKTIGEFRSTLEEMQKKWNQVAIWRHNYLALEQWLREQLKLEYQHLPIKIEKRVGEQIVAMCGGWELARIDGNTVYLWRGNKAYIYSVTEEEKEKGRMSPEYIRYPDWIRKE